MVIRKMIADDIEDVYAVSLSSFSQSWTKEAIAKELNNSAASYFVAVQEKKILGYVGMWHMLDEGEIINIAVLKENRQQKVGSVLLEAILEEARKYEVSTLFLEVRESNKPARGLYKKYGFKEIGRRKNYYHEPTEDAVNMCLELKN